MADSIPRTTHRLPDSPTLDRVVAALREIGRRTGLDRTLAIGELVLNQFFGGDARVWRDRRRNKYNSIRRLADRADCPYCRSALNEAVSVYVAVMELPSVRTFGHICAGHIAAVLVLPTRDRHQILKDADDQRWSVRELRRQVVRRRRAKGEKRGRPPGSSASRWASNLRTGVQRLDDVVTQIERARPVPPEIRNQLHGTAVQLTKLGARLVDLGLLPPEGMRRDHTVNGKPAREGSA